MSNGKVRAYGSVPFLKEKLSCGYALSLRFFKEDDTTNAIEDEKKDSTANTGNSVNPLAGKSTEDLFYDKSKATTAAIDLHCEEIRSIAKHIFTECVDDEENIETSANQNFRLFGSAKSDLTSSSSNSTNKSSSDKRSTHHAKPKFDASSLCQIERAGSYELILKFPSIREKQAQTSMSSRIVLLLRELERRKSALRIQNVEFTTRGLEHAFFKVAEEFPFDEDADDDGDGGDDEGNNKMKRKMTDITPSAFFGQLGTEDDYVDENGEIQTVAFKNLLLGSTGFENSTVDKSEDEEEVVEKLEQKSAIAFLGMEEAGSSDSSDGELENVSELEKGESSANVNRATEDLINRPNDSAHSSPADSDAVPLLNGERELQNLASKEAGTNFEGQHNAENYNIFSSPSGSPSDNETTENANNIGSSAHLRTQAGESAITSSTSVINPLRETEYSARSSADSYASNSEIYENNARATGKISAASSSSSFDNRLSSSSSSSSSSSAAAPTIVVGRRTTDAPLPSLFGTDAPLASVVEHKDDFATTSESSSSSGSCSTEDYEMTENQNLFGANIVVPGRPSTFNTRKQKLVKKSVAFGHFDSSPNLGKEITFSPARDTKKLRFTTILKKQSHYYNNNENYSIQLNGDSVLSPRTYRESRHLLAANSKESENFEMDEDFGGNMNQQSTSTRSSTPYNMIADSPCFRFLGILFRFLMATIRLIVRLLAVLVGKVKRFLASHLDAYFAQTTPNWRNQFSALWKYRVKTYVKDYKSTFALICGSALLTLQFSLWFSICAHGIVDRFLYFVINLMSRSFFLTKGNPDSGGFGRDFFNDLEFRGLFAGLNMVPTRAELAYIPIGTSSEVSSKKGDFENSLFDRIADSTYKKEMNELERKKWLEMQENSFIDLGDARLDSLSNHEYLEQYFKSLAVNGASQNLNWFDSRDISRIMAYFAIAFPDVSPLGKLIMDLLVPVLITIFGIALFGLFLIIPMFTNLGRNLIDKYSSEKASGFYLHLIVNTCNNDVYVVVLILWYAILILPFAIILNYAIVFFFPLSEVGFFSNFPLLFVSFLPAVCLSLWMFWTEVGNRERYLLPRIFSVIGRFVASGFVFLIVILFLQIAVYEGNLVGDTDIWNDERGTSNDLGKSFSEDLIYGLSGYFEARNLRATLPKNDDSKESESDIL